MTFKELLRKALFYISAPRCVCCDKGLDKDDLAICKSCKDKYSEAKLRECSRCAKPLNMCSCSNYYLESHSIKRLIKVYRYAKYEELEVGNKLIFSLKKDNRKDTVNFLIDEIITAIENSIKITDNTEYVITSVPRRKRAIVKYGFDHAKVMAKMIAKRLNIEYISILKSKSKKAQKETSGKERLKNASFDYKVKENYTLKGKRVLLFDDIVTTGASIGNAGILIKGLSAKEIIGVCVAICYKDSYTKTEITRHH